MTDECNEVATLQFTVPFKTEEEAEIAYNTLSVDKEPKRSTVEKNLDLQGKNLTVRFSGTQIRQIRASLNTLVDHLTLIEKTIKAFPLHYEETPQE